MLVGLPKEAPDALAQLLRPVVDRHDEGEERGRIGDTRHWDQSFLDSFRFAISTVEAASRHITSSEHLPKAELTQP